MLQEKIEINMINVNGWQKATLSYQGDIGVSVVMNKERLFIPWTSIIKIKYLEEK